MRLIRPTVIAATALAVALAASCANDPVQGAIQRRPDLSKVKLVAELTPFDKCDDFLSFVKDEASKQVTAYGLGGGPRFAYDDVARMPMAVDSASNMGAPMTTMAPVPRAAAPVSDAPSIGGTKAESAAPATVAGDGAATGASDAASTGTNNQEADVDEADIVKADGDRIATFRGNQLVIVTMIDGAPHVTTTLALGNNFSGDKLFLLHDRAYTLGMDTDAKTGVGAASVVEISLTGTPATAGRRMIEGAIVDGRVANNTLRLVVTTPGGTGLGFVYPSGQSADSERLALETNQKVIASSTLDDWLPTVSDGSGTRQLIDCDHLYRPAELAGFSMLSIVTISDGLGSLTGTGVLADGQITYASSKHLYVATNQWANPTMSGGPVPIAVPQLSAPEHTDGTSNDVLPNPALPTTSVPKPVEPHTDIHSFSIAGSAPATYEASGRVDGTVLNQYSMSESGGHLRIATTATGDSRVAVLDRDANALVEVGNVAGLGPSEQIKSVRFVGDIAYVVTFRNTDPLYVIDLSNPSAPRKLGEVKLPGFSSYLQPVGDHLVLGVGSSANEQGRINGSKLSLFDTSDPVNPREVTNWSSRDLSFMVDSDPHAFHWDAARNTAYLPYSPTCYDLCASNAASTNGVLVVKIADGAITEVGRINHTDRTPSPAPTVTTTTEPTTTSTTTTTSAPDTTTTTTDSSTTTVPSTPETTVPSTPAATASSDIAVGEPGQVEPMPLPSPPVCDPAACDSSPYPGYSPSITRVFVIGDRVITLSEAGIAAHEVGTLHFVGFANLQFPRNSSGLRAANPARG